MLILECFANREIVCNLVLTLMKHLPWWSPHPPIPSSKYGSRFTVAHNKIPLLIHC